MFSRVYSVGLRGVEGYLVQVEVDIQDGLPSYSMVGALAPEVREAQDRVRTALKNAGFRFPPKRVTVNLSPADIRKSGTGFDLPIAAGMLGACRIIPGERFCDTVLLGELGLEGDVKPIRGILPMVLAAREQGMRRVLLPMENEAEGRIVPEMEIFGIGHIRDLVSLLKSGEDCEPEDRKSEDPDGEEAADPYDIDYQDVQGQLLMKRATEIAVAGKHNLLYIGPAGSGKTMIAERIPTIMPACTAKERLEISKVYSVCGLLPRKQPLMKRRPFRSPHHSVTARALTGGGRNPIPGEMSLASEGVLFLDELPEFSQYAIEMLRQPLESHKIVLSRVSGRYEFPANFMLVAAMNPCPCSHYPSGRCTCSESQIRRYLGKISKPILDRIDICVEASPVAFEELRSRRKQESSQVIRGRIEKARQIQERRFSGREICFNSEMSGRDIETFCRLSLEEERLFQELYEKLGLSARAYVRILRVARTIADLEGQEQIGHSHLCEAIGYRSLEEKYWRVRV